MKLNACFCLFSTGIAWSFRFPSLSSLSRRKMPLPARPHLDVRQWLNALDLGEYANVFEKFEGVEVSYGWRHLSTHPTVVEDYFLCSFY